MTKIVLEGIEIEITRKAVKHLYLRVRPPDGRVNVSVPALMSSIAVRSILTSRLPWIRKHREIILARKQEQGLKAACVFSDGEIHYFRGKRMELSVAEAAGAGRVEESGQYLLMYVRKGSTPESRKRLMEQFYRNYLKTEVLLLIAKHEGPMGVKVKDFGVKKMKTRWGSCNTRARRIWVNLKLAEKPPEYLEYLVVHEMTHLLETGHNARFKALMDRYYPGWRQLRKDLNRKHL